MAGGPVNNYGSAVMSQGLVLVAMVKREQVMDSLLITFSVTVCSY